MFRLEADGRRLACHPGHVIAKSPHVSIEGRCSQTARWKPLQSVRGFNTMVYKEFQ